jgi:hypothetical protein
MVAAAIATAARTALPMVKDVARELAPELARGAGSAIAERGLNALSGNKQEPVNYASNEDAQQKPAVY